MLWLKFVCPLLVLVLIWFWDRRVRERKNKKPLSPCLEFCTLSDDIRKELERSGEVKGDVLEKLESSTKVYRIMLGDLPIAIALFSWPSSLWRFRVERGEEISLGAYSHIHWVWVSEEHRLQGHFYMLMDNIISDTHRISAGLTIDLEDQELKDIFRKKFEFEDAGTYMKLDYSNWGGL